MSDFFERVLGELKDGRISREAALDLLGRHSARLDGRHLDAGVPLLFAEDWTLAPAPPGIGAAAAGVVACLVDARSREAVVRAFGSVAPGLAIDFATIEVDAEDSDQLRDPTAVREQLMRALAGLRQRHARVGALLYFVDPTHPVDAAATERVLVLLQALHATRLPFDRLLLNGPYDDLYSRCHAESWVGVERSMRVLSRDATAAVVVNELDARGEDLRAQAAHVVAEIGTNPARSSAYRAGRRFVLGVREVEAPVARYRPKAGSTYLVTGGAGALGQLVVRHLSSAPNVNFLLTGRATLDAARMASLEQLSQDGVCVSYEAVDVANAESMRECVARARERFGAVHGVIHAAGVESRGSIDSSRLEQLRDVMRPKVLGTLALDAALRDSPETEFLCSFGSSAAVLGDFGSFDYAIANRFQAAYAQLRNAESPLRVLTIGWPFWDAGGMGRGGDVESTRLYLGSSGQKALGRSAGLRALDSLLSRERGFRIVLNGDPRRIRELVGAHENDPRTVEKTSARSSLRRPAMRGLTVADCVSWDLAEQISELLKLSRDRIQPRLNLTEYGFDSMTLARWAKRIAQHFGIEVTPALFFSHPTLQQVVEFLVGHHADRLNELYCEESTSARAAPDVRETRDAVRADRARGAAPTDEPIAIVGMSGRFPQARSVDELWEILVDGRDAITEIPRERFDWSEYFGAGDDDAQPRMVSKWLGALPGVDEFDPLFFEVSPREAQCMDPRQRLLLQEACNALEDAGYGEVQLRTDRIGVFVGVEQGEYQLLAGAHSTLTGNHDAVLASRLSFVLDLHGPAVAMNTSCSSGLVAAHQACLSLRANECDAAVAAGVNLVLTPHPYLGMSRAGMLSPDGRCFAFDRRANGMVPGEAVVALVFKRLSSAQAAGDPVHAIIAASGINCDGKTNGITAPNGAAQSKLFEEVYERAKITPDAIDYVVAHGTATRLGDPVEVAALDRVFTVGSERRGYCALTSTKANLGHTFAASGLVSLVSLVQALRHETIPASLHCEELSEYIDWARSAFRVNRESRPWPRRADGPRTGAVSAFGMSGTNAHMVVREYLQEPRRVASTAPAHLLALSAATESALKQRARDMVDMLSDAPLTWDAAKMASLSHTLLAHRRHHAHRLAAVVEDRDQAVALLEAACAETKSPALARGRVAADFVERSAIKTYAQSLLGMLQSQQNAAGAYREALTALGDLYCQGYDLDWAAIHPEKPPRLRLPGYPFARQRFWVESGERAESDPQQGGTDARLSVGSSVGVQHLVPSWEAVDMSSLARSPTTAFPAAGDRPLIVGGGIVAHASVRAHYPNAVISDITGDDDAHAIERKIAAASTFDHVIWIAPQSAATSDAELVRAQEHGVMSAFRLIKALLAGGYAGRDLAWTFVTFQCVEVHRGDSLDPAHAGIHGLAGAMVKEHPRWSSRLLDLESDADWLVSRWAFVGSDSRARPWAYREGRWHKQQLVALRHQRPDAPPRIAGGVYVVIGGAGHVGAAWTEHVIREHGAQVIWVGRRPLDARIQACIDRLAGFGVAPQYVVADAGNRESLAAAYAEIKRRHDRIDGVVLSTIHLDPRPLAEMDEEHVRAALRAKIDASINAIDVFGAEPLKLILFFSSVISFIRNPLQGAYAAGCAFADAYARAVRQRFAGTGQPRVKIMNWGFWNRPENLQLEGFDRMAKMGIGLIDAHEAMAALDCLIGEPLDQMGVVKTTKAVLIEGLSTKDALSIYSERAPVDMTRLSERVRIMAAPHEKTISQWSAS